MKNIFIAILLLVGISATAQVPGYQGLRFTAKYNVGIGHGAIFGRPGKLPMLFHHGSLEYVVGRQWVLGVDYGFMTYKAPAPLRLFDDSYSSASSVNRDKYKGRFTQHVASLYGKFFFKRRGFIAPVGPYALLGVYYQYSTNTIYSPSDNNDYYSIPTINRNNITAHHGGLQVGMGRNFVVAGRMVIDLGMTLNITLPPPNAGGFTINTVEQAAYADLILRNLFQLHVGIGALAF